MSKFTHILLSLPSPNPELITELDNLFSDFLWSSKPPKFRKKIVEAEIFEGGLKFHNISTFDSALKLGWLKRFIKSSSKWTVFPKELELEGVFCYGPDYIERIEGMNSNPFWQDVLTSVKKLWKTSIVYDKTVIKEAPLWYNHNFRLQIRRDWKESGIMFIPDLLDHGTTPLSLTDLSSKFVIKINFLEYGKLVAIVKKHFELKNIVDSTDPLPRNSFLNTILSMDKKGVSNLYEALYHKGNHILQDISVKWENKLALNLYPADISRSFKFHHTCFKDCYLIFTQFRSPPKTVLKTTRNKFKALTHFFFRFERSTWCF